VRDQWSVDDLDWSLRPPDLPREKEEAVVQYFTDMAGIERLAGALFAEQRKKVTDPRLKEIFTSFVVDEERHAQCAQRLADFYDVHHHRDYRESEHLTRFRPHFVNAVHYLSAEIANAYITSGELLLDIALLRSLDDYVDDEMSHQAMHLINRDESRHIAVDYQMVEYYSSGRYQRDLAAEPPKSLRTRAKAWWAFAGLLYHAGPFFRDVFFAPMDFTDPSGKRMREAFKRIQLIAAKPEVAARPFTRFFKTLQWVFLHPLFGRVLGRFILRVADADPRVMVDLYTEAEEARARRMSMTELAEEALAVKYQTA
jgi:rubrerythrin